MDTRDAWEWGEDTSEYRTSSCGRAGDEDGATTTATSARLVEDSGLENVGSPWNPLSEGSAIGVAVNSP